MSNIHVQIAVHPGEDADNVARRFKRAVTKSGILEDIRRHKEFRSKSERRRSKSASARKRQRRGDE
jgi:small subunit ribosomal protein S21